jgi:hypothetical protein
MYSNVKGCAVLVAAVLLSAVTALAGESWHKVGDFQADGQDKQILVKRTVSVCQIRAVDGQVTIATVTAKVDGKNVDAKVDAKLGKGEQRDVSIGGGSLVESLTIKDGGGGRYMVFVR